MISLDRDALLCDLAETYGIVDMRGLSATTLAALCVGLRDDSRIKMKISGAKATRTEMLLAGILDRLSILVWFQSEDGHRGINRPKSVLESMMGSSDEHDSEALETFASGADFEAAYRKMTEVSGTG